MHQALECSICLNQPIDSRQLPCGHSFCESCKETLLVFNDDETAMLSCPNKCEKTTTVQKNQTLNDVLIKNFALENMLDDIKKNTKMEVKKCPEQDCPNFISQYCSEFQKMLCSSCVRKHQCHREEHHFINYDSSTDGFQNVCKEHGSFARIVCVRYRNQFICKYCKHTTHKGHEMKDISSYAKQLRFQMASTTYSERNCKSEDDQLDDYREELCKELKFRKMMNIKKYIEEMNIEENRILKEYDEEKETYKKERNRNIESLKQVLSLSTNKEDIVVACSERCLLQRRAKCSRKTLFHFQSISTSMKRLGTLQLQGVNKTSTGSCLDTRIENAQYKQDRASELCESLRETFEALVNEDDFCPQTLAITFNKDLVETLKHIQSYSEGDKERIIKDAQNENSKKELKLMVFSQMMLKDKEKNTLVPFMMSAAKLDNYELLKTLLRLDEGMINDSSIDGSTALIYASIRGHVKCMRLLLQHNCDVDIKDINGRTALMHASAAGQVDCMRLLLQHNCDVDIKDIHGGTALIYASSRGRVKCMRLLLQHNCDVDMKIINGRTALMHASVAGHADCMRLLLQHNCDADMKAINGRTALMDASSQGHVDCMRLLLQHSCDVDMKDMRGGTALIYASSRGHVDCIKLLLQYSCDIDMKDINGGTALMHASAAGQVDCMRLLLQHNCDVDMKDVDGKTALMHASAAGQVDCMRLLLKHSCDVDMKDVDGKTALMHASSRGHADCVTVLNQNS